MSEVSPGPHNAHLPPNGRTTARRRYISAAAGAVGFIVGCGGLGIATYVHSLGTSASYLDRAGTAVSGGACSSALGHVIPPTRTPVIGESFRLSISLIHEPVPGFDYRGDILPEELKTCNVSIYIDAPGFDVGENPRHFVVQLGVSEKYIAVAAKHSGVQEIVLSDGLGQRVVGVHVLANPFFSPGQMFIISGILAALGPLATIPWWLDFLRSRRNKKASVAPPPKKRRR